MKLHTIWTRLRVQKHKEHILYYISIEGTIISDTYFDTLGRRRLARSYASVKDNKGYHRIALSKDTYITPSLSRNVALHFIPNTLNKAEVNHIDGNKDNNSVENLEWCSTAENIRHAIKLGLREPIAEGLGKKGGMAMWRIYKRIPGSKDNSSLVRR